jgi:Holliday junction resolvase
MAKKCSDNEIIEAYKKTKNIWRAAENLGMCGQSVHERLVRLGVKLNHPKWTEEETCILRERYILYRNSGKLDLLAKKLNRTKHLICRKAKEIGLTNYKRSREWGLVWKNMDIESAGILFEKFKKSTYGFNNFCEHYNFGKNGFYDTMKKYFPDEWENVIELKTPKQSLYRLGRHVEYTVRDLFKKNGYFVFRSPASRGPCDLVAIDKGVVVFIQCKRSMVMSVKEWNDFYDLSKSVDAIPVLAGRPTGRGIIFWLLTRKKDGGKKAQPKIELQIEDIKNQADNRK